MAENKNIEYNIYDRPPQPRNKYGVVTNSSIINSSNSLFNKSDFAQSIDISNIGGGNAYIPDFIGSTDTEDGVRGLVPAPLAGQNHSYFLSGDGSWMYDPANAWLFEWPADGLTPTGLGIDGDFNVSGTLSTMNLNVEGRAHFWELVIDKVRATGGQIFISPSSFICDKLGRKIQYSTSSQPFTSLYLYRPDIARCLQGNNIQTLVAQRIYMRNDDGRKGISGTSDVGDMVRCKTFNMTTPGEYHDVSNKDYWTFVIGRGEESYNIVTDEGEQEVSANFIDLAWYFIAGNGDLIPVGSVFTPSGYIINNPLSFDTYDISVCKDKSQLTLTGEHNLELEYPDDEELLELAWYVLTIRGMVVPEDIANCNLLGTSYDPVINLETLSGATPYTSPDYHIEKYNSDPYYPNWSFGYGVFEPDAEDNISSMGSLHDTDRRNVIMLSASTPIDAELKGPAISQYAGIDIFGLSISRFRITAISYGRNIFKGDFEVLAANGQYTNILTVTADQTQNMVSDAYNGAISYTTQRADEISTYVYNSYAYALSFTTQTAYEISSVVADLEENTYSEISQLSDRIDLSVTKNDMEMVGIHLDGVNSTVDIVGSLTVKQNGDGDVDTVKVYDENNVMCVEITPDSIPDKDDLAIDEMWKYYEATSSSYSSSTSSSQYVDYDRDGISYARNHYILTDFPVSVTIGASIGNFSGGDTINIRNIEFSGSYQITFKKETTRVENERAVINSVTYRLVDPNYSTVSSGSCAFTQTEGFYCNISDISNIPLSVSGEYRLEFTITALFSKTYKLRDNEMPSEPYTFTVRVYNSRITSNIYYLGGAIQPFMEIGTDGFYYTSGNNRYMYSGANEFEVRYDNNILNINDSRVRIENEINTITVSQQNNNISLGDESVVYVKYGGGSESDNLSVTLPRNYGTGRTLTIIGFLGLRIYPDNDTIYLLLNPFNYPAARSIPEYIPSSRPLILDTHFEVANYSQEYRIKSSGIIQFLHAPDGWHILNNIY